MFQLRKFIDTNIDELLDIQHSQLSSRVERWMYDWSGWTTESAIQYQLVISEISPREVNSYFPLSKELINSIEVLINNQSKDNECFRWCLVRCLNLLNKNPAKIRYVHREFATIIKIIFLLMYLVMKMKHHIVFILQKKTFEKDVHLLLLSNSKNFPYVLFKDFNWFTANKKKTW